MVKTKTVAESIQHLRPCSEAKQWVRGYTSAAKAWKECPRGDWMLWLIGQTTKSEPWSEERKPLVACALDCAELVKHLRSKKYAKRLEDGIAVLRSWIKGKSAVAEAKKACDQLWEIRQEAWRDWAAAATAAAADAATAAATAAAADAAAAAAADAAATADAAADAAATAAATAAAADAAATADAAARAKVRAECANIVRKHFPKPPTVKRPKKVTNA